MSNVKIGQVDPVRIRHWVDADGKIHYQLSSDDLNRLVGDIVRNLVQNNLVPDTTWHYDDVNDCVTEVLNRAFNHDYFNYN